jgi:hypothetical protein
MRVVAGVMCAYGTFTLVAAVAGALLDRLNVYTEFRSNDWTGSGAVALASAIVVLLAASSVATSRDAWPNAEVR